MLRIAGLVAGLAIALYYFLLAPSPSLSAAHPVCIVGAGPAGLAAAAKLELRGKAAVVFEKQRAVGGKCQAVYDNNTFIPLGAFMYSGTTYREVQKIVDAVGVAAVPFVSGEKWAYDWRTGDATKTAPPPAEVAALIRQEFVKYVGWWQENFAPYNSGSGYQDNLPAEFFLTTAQWFGKHEYKALPLVFSKIMVAYGYGDFREVPILYMLQYFAPDVAQILLRVSQGQPIDIIDFHDVFVRYAQAAIKSPIHLDTTILKIDRTQPTPIISYQAAAAAPQTQRCSAVVLAFPPTLSSLAAAGLALTDAEAAVFGGVATNNYWSGAVRTAIPYGVTLTAASDAAAPLLPPTAAGQPVTVIKLQRDSDVTTVGSWDALGGAVSTAEAHALLTRTLGRLNRDPNAGEKGEDAAALEDHDVVSFEKMEYFPHFDAAQLRGGVYDRFRAVQGSNQTYWASGLNMMELVEYAVRAGQDVVEYL